MFIEEKKIKWCLLSMAAFVMCLFCIIYPIEKVDDMPWVRSDPYVTHKIIALADASAIQGRVYMRQGYINEVHRYTYGYEAANGGMKIQQVNVDQALVFFTDEVNPCAKWYKEAKRVWYLDWERYTCDIYLPTNALVADYTIDLQ